MITGNILVYFPPFFFEIHIYFFFFFGKMHSSCFIYLTLNHVIVPFPDYYLFLKNIFIFYIIVCGAHVP